MSLFDFFLQEFGGAGLDDDASTTADTRTAVTEAETDAPSASDSAATTSSSPSGVLVDREDVTAPPPIAPQLDGVEDLSDIASNDLNSVSRTEDTSSAGAGDAARAGSDDTTISSVSMDDLLSLSSMPPNAEDSSGNIASTEANGAVIIESISSEPPEGSGNEQPDQQGRRWNRLRLPNLRPHPEASGLNGQTIISSTLSEADEDADVPSSSAPSLSFNPSDIDSALDTPSSLESFSAIPFTRSDDGRGGEGHANGEADLPKSPHSDPWPESEPTGHARDVFSAVGSSLLLPSRGASSAAQEGQTKNIEWWKYLSEKDWERLQAEASSILDSMETAEEDILPSLPSPPPLPQTESFNLAFDTFADLPPLSQDARSSIIAALPHEFICPICDDIIVGAVVVGCGCPRSTCCFQCLQGGGSKPPGESSPPDIQEVDEDEEEEDYVLVERPPETTLSKYNTELQDLPVKPTGMMKQDRTRSTPCSKSACPSCGKADTLIVPCHALDVAICNSISNLSISSSEDEISLQAFLYYYYRRLEEWRQELLSRRTVLEEEKDHRRQKMLALLIEAEEATLWSKASKKQQQNPRRPSFWARQGDGQCTRERNGFGEIAFLAGAIAIATIIGIKLIRRC